MAKILSTSKFERQIATAEKRLAKYNENLQKYKDRITKQEDKLSKISTDFREYTSSWDFMKIYGDQAGNLLYSYQSNLNRITEIEKEIAYENRLIAKLQAQIDEITTGNNNLLDSTKILVDKFEEVLSDYKKEYIKLTLARYKKHYEYAHKMCPEWKATIKKAKSTLPWYYTSDNFKYYSRGYLKYIDGDLYYLNGHGDKDWKLFTEDMAELYKNYCRAKDSLRSDALRYNSIDEYIDKKREELIDDWNKKILTVADKCKKFGVDVDNITVNINMRPITEGSIDMWIEDGSNHRIYARMIWAAEYSDSVSAHIRFIVTQKKM